MHREKESLSGRRNATCGMTDKIEKEIFMEENISRYETRMKNCSSMTDLLIAMSSWQTYCKSHTVTEEDKERVDRTYLQAESRLLTQVKHSLW